MVVFRFLGSCFLSLELFCGDEEAGGVGDDEERGSGGGEDGEPEAGVAGDGEHKEDGFDDNGLFAS